MDRETLDEAIRTTLNTASKKMEKLIEEFNENNDPEIDTVDLDSKFEPLYDYVEDYSE